MNISDPRFVRDIHEMERIANGGRLTRERFVELHGQAFAEAVERFVNNPWN